ncbi:PilZ domain-containing protein [Clostridium saccharoperbutylacetonicum]|jgi:hypothetical protein
MGAQENAELINNRKFFRVYTKEPICTEMSIVNYNGQPIKSNCSNVCIKDLSIGGLSFSSKLKFPMGEHIIYQFKLQILNKPYSIKGNIVWHKVEKNGDINYGVSSLIDEIMYEDYFAALNNLALVIRRNQSNHGCSFCNIKKCPNNL